MYDWPMDKMKRKSHSISVPDHVINWKCPRIQIVVYVWQSHSDRHSYTLGHSHRRTEDSAFAVEQPHRNRQCQAALANICFGIALITLPLHYPCEGLRKIQQITASQQQTANLLNYDRLTVRDNSIVETENAICHSICRLWYGKLSTCSITLHAHACTTRGILVLGVDQFLHPQKQSGGDKIIPCSNVCIHEKFAVFV